jgi:hypothetical protein
LRLSAGSSGNTDAAGGASRAGGSITKTNVELGNLSGSVEVNAGNAGQGASSAGRGGDIKDLNVLAVGNIGGRIGIFGGSGGKLMGLKGKSGLGGAVSQVDVEVRGSVRDVLIFGGEGGDTTSKDPLNKRPTPSAGGMISQVDVINKGLLSGSIDIRGGVGGDLGLGQSFSHRAGTGGAVKLVTIINQGEWNGMYVRSGDGGAGMGGTGTTGDSGAVSKIAVFTGGPSTGGEYKIASGLGGGIYGYSGEWRQQWPRARHLYQGYDRLHTFRGLCRHPTHLQ